MTTLDDKLDRVLGAKSGKALETALGLRTAGDLLRHYPRRYAERGELTSIAGLEIGEHATVLAQVERATTRRMRSRRGNILEVRITDGHRHMTCTFFNQSWRERELLPGRKGLFAGKVTAYRGQLQLAHPEYKLLDAVDEGEERSEAEEFASTLIPVYPAAQGLPSWSVARCVEQVLDTLDDPDDPLPEELRRRHRLLDLGAALRNIHRPEDRAAVEAARDRLKWDEGLAVQLALAQRRRSAQSRPAPACPRRPGGVLDAFDARLPFRLTAGQREVGEAVAADLAGEHPMNRLLQGEVGSGKTVVALRAMLQVVDAGRQAAMLAPTEVLAAQHARSLREMLGDLAMAGELGAAEQATRITLLTGSLPAAQRKQALLDAASGAAGIVVGTHALIQERVSFADLGLVVVDEQHRFGVEQRDALRARGGEETSPHVLVMTATPIPRTVAMTVYGDLETSALREMPVGRSPIATTVVPAAEKPAWLDRVWQRIVEEVRAGHQAYVVCPRIGDGGRDEETPDAASGAAEPEAGQDEGGADGERRPPLAVLEVAPALETGPLAGLRVGVLHGRLPSDEKDAVMRAFAAGEVDVLVATTVVEVGVNVPNATVMVIMDADRFGVSQLHQLRGRVGRGSAPGLCLLVTEAPGGTTTRERLDAVASTLDGFELARLDLELRREGDILGAAQSGRRSTLRLLSLLRDEDLIAEARVEAQRIVAADPDLVEHPGLARMVAELVDDERAEYLEKA
ncbi:ATP-dependent DNA helicase RecG [Streptoalloteichus tenebrarius]|uniref:ATP-dependent DNA helicase RecG n=1 Tax=Streptoalloteichus tenebrarius (strain ATCC 17920 / DSM 40477 / JCM 4838 / CBS 697.72 / NBRC 16177 / NCIMB 11028 / NRRL B-12390 / A12253. 1 / ISP 5477) TaxID=1933 RepID=A0ABT1HZG2_STRSD|nr:ATP-dependent DNA helicase RecG [Streptoalloteichus tenebrarius]MCP2260924.1 ATP-dependent DNA helicase RecG [Streptoalloteichus tenebrarius]BFF03314.1 ATP-dependent DNA helicase RecG [Streptoalloteichus tenebrarius]